MKYCSDCETEINSDSEFSLNCENSIEQKVLNRQWSVMSIVMFIISVIVFCLSVAFTVWNFTIDELGFLLVWVLCIAGCFPSSVVSLALSIAAVCLTIKLNKCGKGLAITDLVLSALAFCLSCVVILYPLIIKQLA